MLVIMCFSSKMAVALVVVVACSTTWARSAEESSSPVASLIRGRSLSKRANFDPSCTGVYDRELLGRLSRLCDDCYNVFREPKVATECRWGLLPDHPDVRRMSLVFPLFSDLK